ncbi:hypothetical protein AAY86_04850 [Pseudomonas amygdali pv. tabaci str. ATCC 11528]|uniref:Uncharacterized protein n=3 Tax=Pseudomonas syringae group genomosp. 2 TaxID=251698 RepID=A0ABV4PYE8_9PSED|nr:MULTISPECIES: hypothetical protein [Pseudomonas syringae group]KEZ26011.1 hypothetical protein A3SK_0118280 [Pseudomonas amygdali pv. tabaci str. 6605]KEZ65429.1 hypothetical protein C1E_0222795 [Pseudomonas amygdali pv. tabaci str. ATCC 11528]KKY54072.1 hypothetical protein AAY86_04850 [Pseudomonas amygdali pv. tabaci str. ATCC 11528]MDU8627716.1 hypothetical protein [Pseudomonas syringae group sp. 243L2]QED84275.1 hypothetical protein PSYTB_11585 [Pseudomonas amygdali pv. tabaci str. ATCC
MSNEFKLVPSAITAEIEQLIGQIADGGFDDEQTAWDMLLAVATHQPDSTLCKFYEVEGYPDLVRELVGHVSQLQDSAKRNVKPWEDTFPPTLLPAYIDRVNAENSSAQPATAKVVLPERLDLPHRDEFESADQHAAAVGEAKTWNACLDEVAKLNTPQ